MSNDDIIINQAFQDIDNVTVVRSDNDLKAIFAARERGLNDVLEVYINYKDRSYNQLLKLQKVFFYFAISLLVVITAAFILGMCFALALTHMTEIITAIISFVSAYVASTFTILRIVAKYLFPNEGVKQETKFLDVISKRKL